MEKYIYDSSNGLWYELHGDYYLPCLVIPEEEIHTIGIWGRKHLDYIKDCTPIWFSAVGCTTTLLTLTLRLETGSTCL